MPVKCKLFTYHAKMRELGLDQPLGSWSMLEGDQTAHIIVVARNRNFAKHLDAALLI